MVSSLASDATVGTSNATSSAAATSSSADDPNAKICKDLETVEEKISLCHAMLMDTKGEISKTNEALLGVIGFLEACAPRMVELVQTGTSGSNILQEETIEKCFQVHDLLNQTLNDMDDPQKWQLETTTVASKPAANDADLDDLLGIESSPTNLKKEISTTGKTTGLNDEDDDPFNTFVNDRVKANPDSK